MPFSEAWTIVPATPAATSLSVPPPAPPPILPVWHPLPRQPDCPPPSNVYHPLYPPCSLGDIARQAGLASPGEAEAAVLRMIDAGEVCARIR